MTDRHQRDVAIPDRDSFLLSITELFVAIQIGCKFRYIHNKF